MYLYNEEALEQELRKPTLQKTRKTKKETVDVLKPFLLLTEEEILRKTKAELEQYVADIGAIVEEKRNEWRTRWHPVIEFKKQKTVGALKQLGLRAGIHCSGAVTLYASSSHPEYDYIEIYGKEPDPSHAKFNVISVNVIFHPTSKLMDGNDFKQIADLKMHYEQQKDAFWKKQCQASDQLIEALHQVDLEADAYAASLGLVWGRD